MRRVIFLSFIILFFTSEKLYPYWIWTPKTGKWINPKYRIEETPQEQLKVAITYFERKDYKNALREFKKLLRVYPKSFEASEAQFYIGRCLEEEKKFYQAYQAYEHLLKKYPITQRTEEAIEREFIVGKKLAERPAKFLGLSLWEQALEVFESVIKNSPYGKYAAEAKYQIGLIYQKQGMYLQAKEAFEEVVSGYPESEWVEAARYQIALCNYYASLEPEYDQSPTQEAKKIFEEISTKYKNERLKSEAKKYLSELEEKEAESNFKIGQFYEKQKAYDSAKIYYEYILKNYPRSKWAESALQRLKNIGALK